MKKLILAALPAAFLLVACDGDRENVGEEVDKMNDEGKLIGKGPAEAAGEELDKEAASEAKGMEGEADAIREGAAMEADQVVEGAEAQADTISDEAKALEKTTH